MAGLIHEFFQDSLQLGNHEVHHIKELHGSADLPGDLKGADLLSLQLPCIRKAGELDIHEREFYLCYSLRHSFFFIVEAEVTRLTETSYRAQYGANDNYDTRHKVQRSVWIYSPTSERARDPIVANHLKAYLAP
jgi:hypothetical protein